MTELPIAHRANLIRTAVVFLRSPRVVSASDEKKRLFLQSKSLSEEEIDAAIALAADPTHEPEEDSIPPQDGGADGRSDSLQDPLLRQPVATSSWSVLSGGGGRILLVVIFGGLSYAVYFAYVKFVQPFLRRQKERDERLAVLEESVRALQVTTRGSLLMNPLIMRRIERYEEVWT